MNEIEPVNDPQPVAVAHAMRLVAEQAAVRSLIRAVAIGVAIAVPLCIAIWVGIVAVAVGDDPDWGVWIGAGSAVGIFAGSFYGGWAGFVAKAHLLENLDAHPAMDQVH